MGEIKSKVISIINWILVCVNILGWAIVFGIIILTKLQFLNLFKEIGISLPFLTQLFLSIPLVVYGILFFIIAIGLAIKEFIIPNKTIALFINIAVTIGCIILSGLYVIALFLPLVTMIEELSKK